ncbi:MAG: hypothetical protein WBN55_11530, partial [Eudoraea sp.]|uniref:hypothetical protein n=1 Tax=Eudoraea sp. TaxID=1979955 RepID=UPI003C776C46
SSSDNWESRFFGFKGGGLGYLDNRRFERMILFMDFSHSNFIGFNMSKNPHLHTRGQLNVT